MWNMKITGYSDITFKILKYLRINGIEYSFEESIFQGCVDVIIPKPKYKWQRIYLDKGCKHLNKYHQWI